MKIKLSYILIFVITLIAWRIFNQIRTNYIPYSEKDYDKISEFLDIDTGIVAILIPNKKYYRIGENPDFDLIFINRTDSVIYLPGSLDGSPNKTRLPYCDFEVLNRKINKRGTIDVTPNPLIKEDLVRLEPNESFNAFNNKTLIFRNNGYDSLFNSQIYNNSIHDFWSPFEFGHKRFIWPGKYELRIIYSTIPDTNIFAGWNTSEIHEINDNIIDSIPKFETKSNIVTIRYSLF
jgi:hypothetical protein